MADLPKLALTPAQDGYSVADGEAVLRAKPGAGPSRMRLDMFGAPSEVSVIFQLDGSEYQYWRAFIRSTLVEGSLPFLIDLLLDLPDLTTHEARIIPGTVRLVGQRGLLHTVQANLEVKPLAPVDDTDEAVTMLFDAYGVEASAVLLDLEHLVNFDMAVLER